ncbi:DUF3035 domain-containing protein [Sulfitobacter sp. D35]|uniref:DUF3035 domain-containing protein n=1 Tax=Sulfitobacter sp. D35 TaxID=3083252 RepID=UPI00296E3DF9|nr:DUF3035 domain-containing protein [Sulfitobacter sp. D35]MDW4498392.1 DUF3035 domain-containing protein [Sulfitobacter sp. D35]
MRLMLGMILTSLVLGGCANKGLHDLRRYGDGPDEFIVLPKKPLEQPQSYAQLPAPTPGQANRTDVYPVQDALAAVGGQAQSPLGPVPASDAALVAAASRHGVAPNIRQVVAEEDAEFRRRKARLTQYRIVPTDSYNEAYRREALNQGDTAQAWRRAGARTPSYPPQN